MIDQKGHDGKSSGAKNKIVPSASATPPINTEQASCETQTEIEKFKKEMSRAERNMLGWSRVVGVFTVVLAVVGILQVYAFIESERAFLIVTNLGSIGGEPSTAEGGFDLFLAVKNIGKHVANVSSMIVDPEVYIVEKKLADEPVYEHSVSEVISPIPPATDVTFPMFTGQLRPPPPMTAEQQIRGILDGTIPVRVFGFIDYDKGYPSWNSGRVAFCFEYVPPTSRKLRQPFKVCQKPKYTYTR